MGEHIADYYCLEHYGWGKSNWDGHDKGTAGHWKQPPGKTIEGKISNHGKLFKLGDSANGQGIDAVWRANSHNEGKLHAIVEAKASKSKTSPSYIKTDKSRKPSISSRLGVNGIPKAEEILDPSTEENTVTSGQSTAKKGEKKKGKNNSQNQSTTPVKSAAPAKADPQIIVQMSHEWIKKNIKSAVPKAIFDDILDLGTKSYSRHLFYTPLWLPAAVAHGKAYLEGNTNSKSHANHDIIAALCYDEAQVKAAVNRKKAGLRKKYGDLNTLKEEK